MYICNTQCIASRGHPISPGHFGHIHTWRSNRIAFRGSFLSWMCIMLIVSMISYCMIWNVVCSIKAARFRPSSSLMWWVVSLTRMKRFTHLSRLTHELYISRAQTSKKILGWVEVLPEICNCGIKLCFKRYIPCLGIFAVKYGCHVVPVFDLLLDIP